MRIALAVRRKNIFSVLAVLLFTSCLNQPAEEAVPIITYQVKEDYRSTMDLTEYRDLYPEANTVPSTLLFEQELLPPIFEEMSEGGVDNVYPFLTPGQQALYKLTELRAFMEDTGIVGYLRSPAGAKTEELKNVLMHIKADQIVPELDEFLAKWEVEGWKNKVLPNIRTDSGVIDPSGIDAFDGFYFKNETLIQEQMLLYLKEYPEDFIQLAIPDSTKEEQVDTL